MVLSLQTLATEILVRIFEEIAEDISYSNKSLQNLGLTCKRFLPIAEWIFYREITVRCTNEATTERFHRLVSHISNTPRLKGYVQYIYVYEFYPRNHKFIAASYREQWENGDKLKLEMLLQNTIDPRELEYYQTAYDRGNSFRHPLDNLIYLLPELTALKKFSWCPDITGPYLQEHFLDALRPLAATEGQAGFEVHLVFDTELLETRLQSISFVHSLELWSYNFSDLKHLLEVLRACPNLNALKIILQGGFVPFTMLIDPTKLEYEQATEEELSKLKRIIQSIEFRHHYEGNIEDDRTQYYEIPDSLGFVLRESGLSEIVSDSSNVFTKAWGSEGGYKGVQSIGAFLEDRWKGIVNVDVMPIRDFVMRCDNLTHLEVWNAFGVFEADCDGFFQQVGPRLHELVIHEFERRAGLCRRNVLSIDMIKTIGRHCRKLNHFGMDVNYKNAWPFFVFDAITESFSHISHLSLFFEIGTSRFKTPLRPAVTETSAAYLWEYIYSKMLSSLASNNNKSTICKGLEKPALRILDLTSGNFFKRKENMYNSLSWLTNERQRFCVTRAGLQDQSGMYACTVTCREVEEAKLLPESRQNTDPVMILDYAVERAKTGAEYCRWPENPHYVKLAAVYESSAPVEDGDNFHR
ncbi:hypothetical protein TWF694_001795 [Orbilia ellipsospora]|uniref:F-box domain-containing protein n=1 Tax=Orbilia ellipsospora TaxID=2528407 RepID=A0AAV9X525_9PEZI